ncbi:hypothetical protein K501DRAFT_294663 [Backusella circina FSU 941]|nr:hypothetical protein K501DRAFT_294663 [Backusella circina FSU 941]
MEDQFLAIYVFHTTNQDISDREVTFNHLLVFPFLRAVVVVITAELKSKKIDFCDGEVYLESMSTQLRLVNMLADDRHQCKADGIIKMYGYKKIEVALLETSSYFGCTDQILFIHATNVTIYLWSMSLGPEGDVYDIWLEGSLYMKPHMDDKLECISKVLKFYWKMKNLLKETCEMVMKLKEKHDLSLIENEFKNPEMLKSLSDTVNPSILRLIEEEGKTDMANLGPWISHPQ